MARTHRNRSEDRWDDVDPRAEQREVFQERVARGVYKELYDPPVRMLIEEGAALQGVEEELGAIRFALARLMNEEEDPSKLATGVARLASATVQLLRVVRPAANQSDDPVLESVNQILIDLEKEARAAREAVRPAPDIAAPKKPYLTRFK